MRRTITSWILFSLLLLYFWVIPTAGAPRMGAVVVDVTATAEGQSAEEVERQVTIPLEVALAGIPGLDHTRSRSLPGLARIRLEFRAGTAPAGARQEVLKRLQLVPARPPEGAPQLSTSTAADQLVRYVLRGPRDASGKDVYTCGDLRSLQEWVLEREFRRVPGIGEVRSAGGAVKRYEVHPDPERLSRYGVTLQQLQTAIAKSSGRGLIGRGQDPVQHALTEKDARAAGAYLRSEERRRLHELRQIVVASVNVTPIRVGDVVEGGPIGKGEEGQKGVVVAHQPRGDRTGLTRPGEQEEDDLVHGVVLLRPGEDPQQALRALRDRIKELNEVPGRLLPGVRIEPYYERPAISGTDESLLWVRGAFPVNVALDEVSDQVRKIRSLLSRHPEVREVVSQIGQAESGMAAGFDQVGFFVRLRPAAPGKERRSVRALADELAAELSREIAGVGWDLASEFRDDMQEAFTPGPGQGLLKIFGPDLEVLERLASGAARALSNQEGVSGVQVTHVLGRESLEFRADPEKCKRWGVPVADLQKVLQAATGGILVTAMIEGEKTFDVRLRWPERLRANEASILDIPVDVPAGPAPLAPRRRLRDLVSSEAKDGRPAPKDSFLRYGAAAIYREEGRRLIGVHFRLHGRDPGETIAAARKKLTSTVEAPYRAELVENLR
jgi:Cu/Ag efflux pump CusA